MKIEIGKSYRVIKNRGSFYGCCDDIEDLEGKIVKVIDGLDYYNEDSFNILDGNKEAHVCESCNLEELNNNYISEEE